MAKRIVTVNTPVGTFTRTTATPYTHAVVRAITATYGKCDENGKLTGDVATTPAEFAAECAGHWGVYGRYAKDHGYVVSYHATEAAARKAAADATKDRWYVISKVVGVFPVTL